jgi:hypothetical protein
VLVVDLVLDEGSGLALLDRIRASDGLSSRIDPDRVVSGEGGPLGCWRAGRGRRPAGRGAAAGMRRHAVGIFAVLDLWEGAERRSLRGGALGLG